MHLCTFDRGTLYRPNLFVSVQLCGAAKSSACVTLEEAATTDAFCEFIPEDADHDGEASTGEDSRSW
jgi:hypothetical protein